MSNFLRTNKGSVIILVAWALVFLSIVALYGGAMVRQEIIAFKKIEARTRAYDYAYCGAMRALGLVVSGDLSSLVPGTVTLNDIWLDGPAFFKDQKIEDGTFTVSYESADAVSGVSETLYGVEDEERKLNINEVPFEMLRALFMYCAGCTEARAATLAWAVIDWRDADDVLSGKESGLSEAVDYSNSGYAYAPFNRAFTSPEEFLLVKGMDADIWGKVRGYISFYSKGYVNINTSSPRVLMLMGLPKEIVDKIVAYRAGADMREGTSDDNAFTSTQTIVAALNAYGGVQKASATVLSSLVGRKMIDVTSETYSAVVTSRLAGEALCGTIVCVFTKSGRIRYWATR